MSPKKPKIDEKQFRELSVKQERVIDEEKRTVQVAFSSEEPYERYFGTEILDHGGESINLGRLTDGAPVLMDHDARDVVGVIESATVDGDRVGRASLRFGKSERATEVFNDVVDGIRNKISVGYFVNSMQLEKSSEEDGDVYRVDDWSPFEISFVSVPADPTVGVGRSDDKEIKPIEVKKMPEEIKKAEAPRVEVDAGQIRKQELERIRTIEDLGGKFELGNFARHAVNNGMSVDEFRSQMLDKIDSPSIQKVDAPKEIGLSEKEVRQFSFVKAVNALANPTSRRMQEAAAFEFECSRAAGKVLGKEAQGVLVPMDVLTRDLQVGTAAEAGNLKATELLSESFIDMLRNQSSVIDRVTMLDGLVGDLAIPKQASGATTYWVAEAGTPTVSQLATGQVTLAPNTVGAYTDMTRKALLQTTPAIENLVRADLTRSMALEIDRAILNGSGASNQPTGVSNFTNTNDVAVGTNGGPVTWALAVQLETEADMNNANMGNSVYVTNSKVIGDLKTIEKASGTARFLMENGSLNGYDVIVSNQIPSNLTKGASGAVCSQMFFGDFSQVILGMWGGLDLTIDQYALATSGGLRIIALQDVDVAGRHEEAFSVIEDLTTNA